MRIRSRTFFIFMDKLTDSVLRLAFGVILVRVITKEMYGDFRLVLMIGTLFSSLSNFGLTESLYYFLASSSPSQRKKPFSCIIYLGLLISGLFSACMFYYAVPISAHFGNSKVVDALRIFSLAPPIGLLRILLSNSLITTDKPVLSTVINFCSTVIRLTAVVFGFSSGHGIEYVIKIYIIIEAISATVLFLACIYSGQIGGLTKPELSYIIKIFSYALPLAYGFAISVAGKFIDKFLISTYFSSSQFAEYVNGAQDLPFIGMITVSISTAILPNLVKSAKKGDYDSICRLFGEAMRRSSLILLPIFGWAVIVSRDIIIVLYGTQYLRSWYPFLVYLFVLPVRVVLYSSILRAIGKTKALVWSPTIALLTNISIGFAFVHFYGNSLLGFIGPAIGHVISIYLSATITSKLLKRELNKLGYYGKIFNFKDYFTILVSVFLSAVITFFLTSLPLQSIVPVHLLYFSNFFSGISRDDSVLIPLLRIGFGFLVMFISFYCIGHFTGAIKRKDQDMVKNLFYRIFHIKRKLISPEKNMADI